MVACGFDGLGSGDTTSSSDPTATTATSSGGPTMADPNGDGGPMSTAICQDRVLAFDGVDDVAGVSTADPLNLPGDFTVEAWVKPSTVDLEMEVVSHGSANDSTGWILRIKAGHVEASLYGQGRFLGFIPFAQAATTGNGGDPYVVAGKWAFIAATLSGNTLRVYHDGALKGSTAIGFGRYNFGGTLSFGNGSSHPYAGDLDDVRLSKVAEYTGNTHVVPTAALSVDPNTIALWHFDEPSDIFLKDETGAHDGIMATDSTAPMRVTAPCPASR